MVMLKRSPSFFFLSKSALTTERITCPCLSTCWRMDSTDVGTCEWPIAIRPLRRSFDIAMTLNDKPSHAVSRLSTAGNEFSPVSIKYFFMGPGPVEHFEVDCCGSSSTFLFETLQLWNRFRCSWSPLVEPPVAFRIELHILHFAEWPCLSGQKYSHAHAVFFILNEFSHC